ncbi:3-hydroxyacyl-ACP dehydratase FabZ family protein [Nonlabens xiamenensis]|uniref:3-hydroxyacyl-ACP dehydratase FabZ family protein n=1 Tax=Nonlabens xiamenensis TaxID=2341043 RepID=UPI000F605954|nr:acyl carrier protein [Nonlabens xiamenensis]
MILDYLERIVANLPYGEGFKFVDRLLEVDEESVVGIYTFRSDAYFYQHHFKDEPITPGVLLTECMAQIGLACLGSHLVEGSQKGVAFTENHIRFLKTVPPNTTVIVSAKKEYFRFNKLKVIVQMLDEHEDKVAEGWMSGIMLAQKEE